jgi:hypothetical protein
MKRKAEPTGGTAAEQAERSQVRVVGQEQEEEHASNFLSALPDLALRAVLDCLQQQESGAPTLRRDGMRVCGLFASVWSCSTDAWKKDDSRSLPEFHRLETLHEAFLDYQESFWKSIASSSDEWMAGRHNAPAHFSFVPSPFP